MKTIKLDDDTETARIVAVTHPRPSAFEGELERRLAILSNGEDTDHRLPSADTAVLAALTIGSFVAVLIAQVL